MDCTNALENKHQARFRDCWACTAKCLVELIISRLVNSLRVSCLGGRRVESFISHRNRQKLKFVAISSLHPQQLFTSSGGPSVSYSTKSTKLSVYGICISDISYERCPVERTAVSCSLPQAAPFDADLSDSGVTHASLPSPQNAGQEADSRTWTDSDNMLTMY